MDVSGSSWDRENPEYREKIAVGALPVLADDLMGRQCVLSLTRTEVAEP